MSTARGTLRTEKRIVRSMLRAEPHTLFVFGDNLMRAGYGGQAREMRGEPNAVGIPTKVSPTMSSDAFLSDADYEKVRPTLDLCFNRLEHHLSQGGNVVFPQDGTGLAQLGTRAPRIMAYILARVERLRLASGTIVRSNPKDSWAQVQKLLNLADPARNTVEPERSVAQGQAEAMTARLEGRDVTVPKATSGTPSGPTPHSSSTKTVTLRLLPEFYDVVLEGRMTLTSRSPQATSNIGLRVGEVAKARLVAKGRSVGVAYIKNLGTYATGNELIEAAGGMQEYLRRECSQVDEQAVRKLKGWSLFEISLTPISGYAEDAEKEAPAPFPPCSSKPDLSILPITPGMLFSYIQANLLYASADSKVEEIIQNSASAQEAVQLLIPTFGTAHAKEILALRVEDPDPNIPWAETKKNLIPAGTDFVGSEVPNFGVYSQLFGNVGSEQALKSCFGENPGLGVSSLRKLYDSWNTSRTLHTRTPASSPGPLVGWQIGSRTVHIRTPGYYFTNGVATSVTGPADAWWALYSGESEGYTRRPFWMDLAPIFQAGIETKAKDICILLPKPVIVEKRQGDVDLTGQEGYLSKFVAKLQQPAFFQEMYARLSLSGIVDSEGSKARKEIDRGVIQEQALLERRFKSEQTLLKQRQERAKTPEEKDAVAMLLRELKSQYKDALEVAEGPRRQADKEQRQWEADLFASVSSGAPSRRFSFSIRQEGPVAFYGDSEAVQRWAGLFIGHLTRSFAKGWTRSEVGFRLETAEVMLPNLLAAVKRDDDTTKQEVQDKLNFLRRDVPSKSASPVAGRQLDLAELPSQEAARIVFLQDPTHTEAYATSPLVPLYVEILDSNKQPRDVRRLGDFDGVLRHYEKAIAEADKPKGLLPKGFLPMITAYARLYRKAAVKAAFGARGATLLRTHCLELAGHKGEWFLGFPAALAVEKNWSNKIGMPAEMGRHYPYMLGKGTMPTILRRMFRLDLVPTPTGYHFSVVPGSPPYPWTSTAVPYLLNELPIPDVARDSEGNPVKNADGRFQYSGTTTWIAWDPNTASSPKAIVDAKSYSDLVRKAFSGSGAPDFVRQGAMAKAEGREAGGTARYGGRRQVSGMPVDRDMHSPKGLFVLAKKALSGVQARDAAPDSLGEVGALHEVLRNNWAIVLNRMNEVRWNTGDALLPADLSVAEILELPEEELAALEALQDLTREKQDQYRALMQKSLLKPWREDLERTNIVRVGDKMAPIPQNVPEGFGDIEDPIFAEDVTDTIRAIENRGRYSRAPRPRRPARRARL